MFQQTSKVQVQFVHDIESVILYYTECQSQWDLHGAISYLTNPDYQFLNLYGMDGKLYLISKTNVVALNPIIDEEGGH